MLDVLLTSLGGTAAACSLPDLTAKLGHSLSIYRTDLWYPFIRSSVASTLIFSCALAREQCRIGLDEATSDRGRSALDGIVGTGSDDFTPSEIDFEAISLPYTMGWGAFRGLTLEKSRRSRYP